MTDDEKYLFDLQGYVVLKNALTPAEVDVCNEAIDHCRDHIRRRPREQSLSGNSQTLKGDQGRGDIGGMLTWPQPWCQPFRDLLAHPRSTAVLLELLGDGFRLDHLYGILMTAGTEGHVLHGSGTSDSLTHFYRFHNNRMRCGLTVVSWIFTDCGPGDGGFACIPGSHKSNYATPSRVAQLDRDLGCVRQVEASAGDCIVFTEALTHGTLPWTAAHERRSILYKYSPGTLSYASKYLPGGVEEVLEEFTPQQRAVLEPPYRPNRPSLL